MLLLAILFSVLRPHISRVYAPKLKYGDQTHAPPKLGNGVLAWVPPVATTKESQLVEKIGLDATVFLRFTKMCRNMFLVLGIVGVGILIPANVVGSDKEASQSAGVVGSDGKMVGGPPDWFALMTPQYVHGKNYRTLWSHVISSYLIDLVIAFFLWRNYLAITRLRREYFNSPGYQMSLSSRTLMLTDIPPALRTNEGILRLADQVEQSTGLPRATIGRNVKELPELIEEHETTVRKLESVLAKYLKKPDNVPSKRPTLRPSKKYQKNNGGEKVDAIDYLTERIRELEVDITHVRESIDKRNPMPFGFASYERIEEAHMVAYAARNRHPQGATIRLAPQPKDLIWKNLPLSKKSRRWKRFMNNFWIAVLTFIWIAPNALIAIFLSSLSNLALVWPSFQKNFNGHRLGWSIVQGIASPALTSLVYLLLPIAFRRLSIRAGDTTKFSRERHVLTKLYAFFIFNNLIVFSLFSALWRYIAAVINLTGQNHENFLTAARQGDFFAKMMIGLCSVSPFWLTWLLQRNLGAAIDIAQIWNLIYQWFMRTFMNPTPRQAIEWTAPTAFDYADYYNYFLFYATVALCFATLQPLVLPVTAFYFATDYLLKKYLLLYVFITKAESGGQYWPILYNRMIFATIVSNFVIALVLMANGSWSMIFSMIPLPILMLLFKWYCFKTFNDQNKYYAKVTLKDTEHLANPTNKAHHNDRVSTKFSHPALHRKLMTPMVHEKAQHVLSRIYRGRMNTDNADGGSNGYSGIAMDPMSQSQPGKVARFDRSVNEQKQRDMFEVVPESQLDFAFYKGRAEFADEHGGDGELYGRPPDLVSERSSTPRSFLGRGSDSITSSRASSPGPDYGAAAARRGLRPDDSPDRGSPYSGREDLGARGMYTMNNESESRLLHGAQPLGVADDDGREQYGLDRWRTGGSGYVGVPGMEGDQGGYETYRGRR